MNSLLEKFLPKLNSDKISDRLTARSLLKLILTNCLQNGCLKYWNFPEIKLLQATLLLIFSFILQLLPYLSTRELITIVIRGKFSILPRSPS